MSNFEHIAIVKETAAEIEIIISGFSNFDSAVSEIQKILDTSSKNVKIGKQLLNNRMSEAEIRQRVRDS